MIPEMTAQYLGFPLASPVVVSACPMTLRREAARELATAGAGALVLPSLFEEQIVGYHDGAATGRGPGESEMRAPGDPAGEDRYNGGPEAYLQAIRNLRHCPGVPVIASLSGYSNGSWLEFARELQHAGADALELTLHADAFDPELRGEIVEQWLVDCAATTCQDLSIPVSMKVAPFFTNLANLARRLIEAGVAGLTVFAHEPVWDVQMDRLQATRDWSLTSGGNIDLTLTGLIRARAGAPHASIAASGGIGSACDAIKAVIAGADVAMVTSEVYRSGPTAVTQIADGIRHYLERGGYESFASLTESRPRSRVSIRDRTRDVASAMPPFYHLPLPSPSRHSGDRWGHMER